MTELTPAIRSALRYIGIDEPDRDDPLHVRLVDSLARLAGEPFGVQIVALKFDFNQELMKAGREFAAAKSEWESETYREEARLILERDFSAAKAATVSRGTDRALELRLTWLMAEQRERGIRKFLETMENMVEVWRTTNANERRADVYHREVGT